MNRISKFFHEILHPHCPDCMLEKQDAKICASCEILKEQISIIRQENRRLLESLTANKSSPEVIQQKQELKPSTNIPWAVRRQMLEREDREQAKVMRAAPKPITKTETSNSNINNSNIQDNTKDKIAELEKELGVENA